MAALFVALPFQTGVLFQPIDVVFNGRRAVAQFARDLRYRDSGIFLHQLQNSPPRFIQTGTGVTQPITQLITQPITQLCGGVSWWGLALSGDEFSPLFRQAVALRGESGRDSLHSPSQLVPLLVPFSGEQVLPRRDIFRQDFCIFSHFSCLERLAPHRRRHHPHWRLATGP